MVTAKPSLKQIPARFDLILGEDLSKGSIPLNRSIGAHFHSGDVELSYVGEDFGEAIGEAVELLFSIAALERAAELFHDMLSSDEGIAEGMGAGLFKERSSGLG